MQIVIKFIKENKKKMLLILFIIAVLSIVSLVINNQRKTKIYLSEEYVYTKESYTHDDNLISKLPYINVKGENINVINNKLISKYYEIITVDQQFMSYVYYTNDNILSLIVKIYSKSSPESYPNEVFIYNVDLNSGTVIDDNQLLKKFNLSNEELSEIIRNDIKDYYDYEIKKGYTASDCNFDCYLNGTNSLPILDNCYYYVKDNYLFVYKSISLNNDFFYDASSGFDLFNFKIKKLS